MERQVQQEQVEVMVKQVLPVLQVQEQLAPLVQQDQLVQRALQELVKLVRPAQPEFKVRPAPLETRELPDLQGQLELLELMVKQVLLEQLEPLEKPDLRELLE